VSSIQRATYPGDLRVSKREFMLFIEAEFDLADGNKDGELNVHEFQKFIYAVSRSGVRAATL
jgi:hypothetical protein